MSEPPDLLIGFSSLESTVTVFIDSRIDELLPSERPEGEYVSFIHSVGDVVQARYRPVGYLSRKFLTRSYPFLPFVSLRVQSVLHIFRVIEYSQIDLSDLSLIVVEFVVGHDHIFSAVANRSAFSPASVKFLSRAVDKIVMVGIVVAFLGRSKVVLPVVVQACLPSRAPVKALVTAVSHIYVEGISQVRIGISKHPYRSYTSCAVERASRAGFVDGRSRALPDRVPSVIIG